MRVYPTLRERFEAAYIACPMSGCWLWTAATIKGGYGHIRSHFGNEVKAHRISWLLHRGPIPAGLRVLHKCDVRCCVNPYHLFLGTSADNTADMCRKGRGRFHMTSVTGSMPGEKHPRAKLTNQLVLEIRTRARSENHAALATEFGVSKSLVGQIGRRSAWRHLP